MFPKSEKKHLDRLFEKLKVDTKLVKLSYFTQLIFYKMIIEQDDSGRLPGNLDDFITCIYPVSRNIPDNEFTEALKELESNNLIIWEKDKVIEICDNKYRPTIGHRKKLSAFEGLNKGFSFFSYDKDLRIERVKNVLERLRRNIDDENGMLKNAQQMQTESNLNDGEKGLATAFSQQQLYSFYYFIGLINIKLLIYLTIIYNNTKLREHQKVIEIYKMVKYPEIFNWEKLEHDAWNKENFKRFVSTATSLLKMCSNLEELLGIITVAPRYFEENLEGVNWTLQTIFKRFADIRAYHSLKLKNIEDYRMNREKIKQEEGKKVEISHLTPEQIKEEKVKLLKKLGLEKSLNINKKEETK